MLLVTDIDPASERCPEPSASWLRWERRGAFAPLAGLCFPPGRPLFMMDDEGRKLSDEFPVLFWQDEAVESQLAMATEAMELLPVGVKRVVFAASRGECLRGHFDRHWAAQQGNIHAAVLLAESIPVSWAGLGLAILPVLALADCAQGLVGRGRSATIKWINDIMVDGAKVGGALSQSAVRGDLFTHAVLGMGLNSASAPKVEPTVFVPRVGSLGLDPRTHTPLSVLKRLLSSLASNHSLLVRGGGRELAARYIAKCESIGRRVRIYEDGPALDDRNLAGRRLLARGKLEEIREDMRLVVGGTVIGSGRLAYEADCPA